jgi:hypothetical protein
MSEAAEPGDNPVLVIISVTVLIIITIYRVSQEERTILREGVP